MSSAFKMFDRYIDLFIIITIDYFLMLNFFFQQKKFFFFLWSSSSFECLTCFISFFFLKEFIKFIDSLFKFFLFTHLLIFIINSFILKAKQKKSLQFPFVVCLSVCSFVCLLVAQKII